MKTTTITVLALSLIASYTTSAGTCSITLYSNHRTSGDSHFSLTINKATYNNRRIDYSMEVNSSKECYDMAAKEVGGKNDFPLLIGGYSDKDKIHLSHEMGIASSVYYDYYSNGKLEDARILGNQHVY